MTRLAATGRVGIRPEPAAPVAHLVEPPVGARIGADRRSSAPSPDATASGRELEGKTVETEHIEPVRVRLFRNPLRTWVNRNRP